MGNISIVRVGGSAVDKSADIRGLSTDTKPTDANGDNVPHGSTFIEFDTGDCYMFDKNTDTWYLM